MNVHAYLHHLCIHMPLSTFEMLPSGHNFIARFRSNFACMHLKLWMCIHPDEPVHLCPNIGTSRVSDEQILFRQSTSGLGTRLRYVHRQYRIPRQAFELTMADQSVPAQFALDHVEVI